MLLFFFFYLECAEDARVLHAFVHGQLAKAPAEDIQMPQNLKNKSRVKVVQIEKQQRHLTEIKLSLIFDLSIRKNTKKKRKKGIHALL